MREKLDYVPVNTFDDILNAYAEQAETEMLFLADNSWLSPALPIILDGQDLSIPQSGNPGRQVIQEQHGDSFLYIDGPVEWC